jgi:amino acid permease
MNQDDEVTSAHSYGETETKDIKQLSGQQDGQATEYDLDAEEKQVIGESAPLPELQRKLKSRHLSMIAIGKNAWFNVVACSELHL